MTLRSPCWLPHPFGPAAERKQVGTANMLLSVANFNEALRVPQVGAWVGCGVSLSFIL